MVQIHHRLSFLQNLDPCFIVPRNCFLQFSFVNLLLLEKFHQFVIRQKRYVFYVVVGFVVV